MQYLAIILITSLGLLARNKKIGYEIFLNKCAPCHTESGHGIRELEAPPIAGLPRWYVTLQLRNFKTEKRGRKALDPEAKKMSEVTTELSDRQILFVSRYVSSLPPLPLKKEKLKRNKGTVSLVKTFTMKNVLAVTVVKPLEIKKRKFLLSTHKPIGIFAHN